MSYPGDGYFTALLNQEGADVFGSENNMGAADEVTESLPLNDMNSQSKPKGRSKNFSEEEDILLVSAFLNVSTDAIIGRDQKDGKFWERALKYFHDNKTFESDRNWSSLKHRWAIIQKEVSVFQGYHDSIERKNESGKTANDKLAEAKAMFHQLQGKAFSVFHAWNILRHEPKWNSYRASKIGQKNPEQCHEIGTVNVQRPVGRKAEKENARVRKRGDSESDPFIEEVKKMREARQESEKERKERDDKFLELEKKKLELEQDQHDKLIMETDTSTMDNESKQYFKLMKEEILSRRFGIGIRSSM